MCTLHYKNRLEPVLCKSSAKDIKMNLNTRELIRSEKKHFVDIRALCRRNFISLALAQRSSQAFRYQKTEEFPHLASL